MRARSLRGVQEPVAGIGPVNARVTTDTRRALRRLNVLRHGRQARPGVHRREVALQAELVHIGLNQQLVIRSPVREMASAASFSRDCSVLMNEGSGLRRVAFGAHYELPSGRGRCILPYGAVRIVAVCAIDHPLFNLVVKGHGELWLDVVVALKAKLGLLQFEQMFWCAGCMDSVAADAAHIAPAVGRPLKVCALAAMACLAFIIHLFGRGRVEDRSGVDAFCVRLALAVTTLGGLAFAAVGERWHVVRIIGKSLYDLFVTCRTDGGVYQVARIRLHRLEAVGIGFTWLSHNGRCAKHRCAQHQHEIGSCAGSRHIRL